MTTAVAPPSWNRGWETHVAEAGLAMAVAQTFVAQ